MKVYISADIEGVAGVVSPEQGQPGNPEYERARRLMTEEVNAAIEGVLDGGATEVVVNDAHGPMRNLLPELLHPAAALIHGKPKQMSMFEGLEADHACVLCIGYHAAASRRGVLAHTTNGFAFADVRLGGRSLGEAGLYGAYAGSLGIPVAMVSGDDCCIAEMRTLFPDAVLVTVKESLGAWAARNLPLTAAREAIRAGASEAVKRCGSMRPFVFEGPFALELQMNKPALADLAAMIPVSERRDGVTVAFPAATPREAIRWVNVVSAMSAVLR